MMDKNRIQTLLDATGGIKTEYIEEAASYRRTRPVWVAFAAVAAVLAILLGVALQRQPTDDNRNPVSFFDIQAYAADGSVAPLSKVGDTSKLQTGTSDLFPGKNVYILDVLFMDAAGDRLDLAGNDFRCFHRGKYLKPGQFDEMINISWVEKDGLSGYRIVGWCDDFTLLDITIRDPNGRILHQKELRIDFDGQYNANLRVSYNYDPNLSTEELIAKLLDSGQDYSRVTILSNSLSAYDALRRAYGGFAELEERSDAAAILLKRWVKEVKAAEHKFASVEYSGFVGSILAQDAHWKNLTEEELALIESYGYSTERPQKQNAFFPGKKTFTYDLVLEGENTNGHRLTATYKGQAVQGKDEHLIIAFIVSSAYADSQSHGWGVMGWFDEPTILTLTVTDKNNAVIRKQLLLIIPTEDDYKINILWETP